MSSLVATKILPYLVSNPTPLALDHELSESGSPSLISTGLDGTGDALTLCLDPALS